MRATGLQYRTYIMECPTGLKRWHRNVALVYSLRLPISWCDCSEVTEAKKLHCSKKHRTTFMACRTGVVYTIPLACGNVYICQTGRCVNVWLLKHCARVKSLAGFGCLVKHCKEYMGCFLIYDATPVTHVGGQIRKREIVEVLEIYRAGDTCVSMPSIALTQKEIDYLSLRDKAQRCREGRWRSFVKKICRLRHGTCPCAMKCS